VVFELEGRDAGTFASQGQLRATMLAWVFPPMLGLSIGRVTAEHLASSTSLGRRHVARHSRHRFARRGRRIALVVRGEPFLRLAREPSVVR
jgi:hypothetical protein